MSKTLIDFIDAYKRPYVLPEEELLKVAKIKQDKIEPIDIEKVIKKAKLNNSYSTEANINMWKFMIINLFVPSFSQEEVKSEQVRRFAIALSIGISHFESLMDIPGWDLEKIYELASYYAACLLCPKESLLKLMKQHVSIPKVAKTFNVPERCAALAINKLLMFQNT